MLLIKSLCTACYVLGMLFQTPPFISQTSVLERRASFDISSGQIKIQVSDVDCTAGKVQVLFNDHVVLPLRDEVVKSLDGRLGDDIQTKLIQAICELIKKAEPFHPKVTRAVATEPFRLAKNGDEVVARILQETSVPVTILSQEEEGILGFIGGVGIAGVEPEKAVVWDFGGGSFQLTIKEGDQYFVYAKKLGKAPVKNVILQLQGKQENESPNPISQLTVDQMVQWMEKNTQDIPESFRRKLKSPDVHVLSVGINPLWGHERSADFDQDCVKSELQTRLNLEDEAIANKDSVQKPYAMYRASNLLFTYAMMKILEVDHIETVDTKGLNAGLVLSPKYWANTRI